MSRTNEEVVIDWLQGIVENAIKNDYKEYSNCGTAITRKVAKHLYEVIDGEFIGILDSVFEDFIIEAVEEYDEECAEEYDQD